MSKWVGEQMRFFRCAGVVGLMLILAACAGAPVSNPDAKKPAGKGFLGGILQPTDSTPAQPDTAKTAKPKPPLAKASLVGGEVVVAGPKGYCLDPKTIDAKAGRGFAVIASCHILSAGKVGSAVEPVLVTVTVGPKAEMTELPSPSDLATTAGATLLGGETGDGFVAANLDRGGDTLLAGGDKRHWRANFVQGSRLVGLALYAPKGSPYAGPHGGSMLAKVRNSIALASPKSNSSATVSKVAKKPQVFGALGRLLKR